MRKSLRQLIPKGKFTQVPSRTSKNMSAVKSRRNKSTEMRLRLALVRRGISGWVLQPKDIPGRPDFYFAVPRVAVFVDGCFWHGCQICGHIPKTNSRFWAEKIKTNQDRDLVVQSLLSQSGVRVLRFWEHELKADLEHCVEALRAALR